MRVHQNVDSGLWFTSAHVDAYPGLHGKMRCGKIDPVCLPARQAQIFEQRRLERSGVLRAGRLAPLNGCIPGATSGHNPRWNRPLPRALQPAPAGPCHLLSRSDTICYKRRARTQASNSLRNQIEIGEHGYLCNANDIGKRQVTCFFPRGNSD